MANEYPLFRDIKTSISSPFELRDPFKRVAELEKEKDSHAETSVIDEKSLQKEDSFTSLQLLGIFLGANKRALFQKEGKDTLTLKEGDHFGKEKAQLKAIYPGGVVFVEKFLNIYEQTEFVETVMALRDTKISKKMEIKTQETKKEIKKELEPEKEKEKDKK